MISALLVALALQTGPNAPAQARPGSEEAAILATINALFAAMEAGDGPALLKHARPDGRVTGVIPQPNGTTTPQGRSFAEYASRMIPGKGFVERITRPAIAIDADIAMVWAPFTIMSDGKLTRCGIDHFDLIREAGTWKVANLTYTNHAKCEPPKK